MPRLNNSCRLVWRTKPRKKPSLGRILRATLGQSTIEYVMMLAFGAVLSLEIVKFFNDIFRDGLQGLERNVQLEVQTGQGFGGGNAP